jgi:hypothetical protein
VRTLGEVFNLFDDRPADEKAAAAARLNGDGDRPVNTIRPSEIDSLAAKWDPDNPKRFVNGLASVLWESEEPLIPDLPAGSRLYRQGDLAGSLTEPGAAIFRGPIGDWLDRIADETDAGRQAATPTQPVRRRRRPVLDGAERHRAAGSVEAV